MSIPVCKTKVRQKGPQKQFCIDFKQLFNQIHKLMTSAMAFKYMNGVGMC